MGVVGLYPGEEVLGDGEELILPGSVHDCSVLRWSVRREVENIGLSCGRGGEGRGGEGRGGEGRESGRVGEWKGGSGRGGRMEEREGEWKRGRNGMGGEGELHNSHMGTPALLKGDFHYIYVAPIQSEHPMTYPTDLDYDHYTLHEQASWLGII